MLQKLKKDIFATSWRRKIIFRWKLNLEGSKIEWILWGRRLQRTRDRLKNIFLHIFIGMCFAFFFLFFFPLFKFLQSFKVICPLPYVPTYVWNYLNLYLEFFRLYLYFCLIPPFFPGWHGPRELWEDLPDHKERIWRFWHQEVSGLQGDHPSIPRANAQVSIISKSKYYKYKYK